MMTFVSDTEPVIGNAVSVAANLKRRGLIQLHDLSKTVSGVDIIPYPPTADCVRDMGGVDKYHAELIQKFVAAGFKLYVEEEVKQIEPPPEDSTDEV